MLEFVFIAIGGIIVTLLLLAPNMKGGGYTDSRKQNLAEANTSLAFLTDDESRAVEYEHRFSGTHTGMLQDRSGYKIRKSEDQKHSELRG